MASTESTNACTSSVFLYIGIVALSIIQLTESSLSTAGCGTTFFCLKSPSSCTSHQSCSYLVMVRQHANNETLEFLVSSKLANIKWSAVGFNTNGLMNGAKGEVCLLPGSGMRGFVNNGYSPQFSASLATLIGSEVKDGALICRFQRNIKANGYQVNLYNKWNIIIAHGSNIRNNDPQYHQFKTNLGSYTLAVKPMTTQLRTTSSISSTAPMSVSPSSATVKPTRMSMHSPATSSSIVPMVSPSPTSLGGQGNKTGGNGVSSLQASKNVLLFSLVMIFGVMYFGKLE